MDEQRIIELEIKLAYQDDLLQALNQAVAQQQQALQRLEATCRLLHERIKSLSDTGLEKSGSQPVHEIPPHY